MVQSDVVVVVVLLLIMLLVVVEDGVVDAAADGKFEECQTSGL